MKKSYDTPELLVHGTVEEITLSDWFSGEGDGQWRHDPPTNDPPPPTNGS